MRTIRSFESHDSYTASSRSSTASGAYQYLDTTWNNYAGFHRAKDAPASVQDQRARQDVLRILNSHGQDVRAVPQLWYYPAGYGKPNLVPPGNSLSMGQYTENWMKIYNSLGGQNGVPTSTNLTTGGAADTALISDVTAQSGTFKEHCILKLPSVNVPLGSLPLIPNEIGGQCLLSSNQARAISGAALVGVGGVILLIGLSVLALGSAPSIPGVPTGFLKRSAPEASAPPMTSVNGQRMLGRSVSMDDLASEQPFPE